MAGDVGIVAIGRNEGERLKACLSSLPPGCPAVYVDSGSTDGSVAFARAQGLLVVELPQDRPFTAARARNAGAAALFAQAPDTAFIQMIDGDCQLDAGWIDTARAALEREPALAVVFGRRRERFPERSIYNRLCDEEWDVPVGRVEACGGDALFRRAAFEAAGGYASDLIAGEEPDLCLRMARDGGWRVRRIGAEMTHHDAAMTRFGQWWRRTRRAGHAYAEHVARHGAQAFPGWRRQVRSVLAWGLALPLTIVAALTVSPWVALLLALAYPAQVARLAWRARRKGMRYALASAGFLVLGKFAGLAGLLQYRFGRLTGRRAGLIEYKTAAGR